jgi:hypothetical protein
MLMRGIALESAFATTVSIRVFTNTAAAQTTISQQAARRFDDGEALITAGRPEEACTKFAESERMESGIGILLRLGDCLITTGRGASARRVLMRARALASAKADPREDLIASYIAKADRSAAQVSFAGAFAVATQVFLDEIELTTRPIGTELTAAGRHELRAISRLADGSFAARKLTFSIEASAVRTFTAADLSAIAGSTIAHVSCIHVSVQLLMNPRTGQSIVVVFDLDTQRFVRNADLPVKQYFAEGAQSSDEVFYFGGNTVLGSPLTSHIYQP